MKKAVKLILWSLAGLVVFLVAGAAILAATFDPNRYKDDLERLAKEQTGRTLKLRGKLELAFFPGVGAKVAGVSFSERGSEQEFVSLESAHVSVKVLPLLLGEVIVDAIRVTGLKAQVVQGKDGRFNFDDLLTGNGAKPAAPAAKGRGGELVKFRVAGVTLERSAITYRDLAAGSEIALSEVRISSGRIAGEAAGRLALSALAKGRNPEFDFKVDLRSDYQLDLPEKIALSKLDARFSGSAAGMTGLELSAAGEVAFDLLKNQYRVGSLGIGFKGANGADALQGELKLAGALGSERTLVVPKFSADVSITSPDLPAPIRTLRLPLSGSIKANFGRQTASAELAGKVDESTLQANIGLAKFAPPSYLFDVDVDRLNLDRYLPQEPASPAPAAKPAAKKETDTPVDLSFLKGLNASGRLQVGAFQVRGLKLANLRAELKAANGRMDVAPHSASLYEGVVAGALTLQADGNRIALRETLSNVSIGPLLRDVARTDRLEGKGRLALDVTGSGGTVGAMKKALAGTAKVSLKDGAIKGIDIAAALRKADSPLGRRRAAAEQTDFSELSASFLIKDGVARNEDLELKSPVFKADGRGRIDIGNSNLDYLFKASLAGNFKVTVPVRVTGPFAEPQYEINYGAVAADVAKTKVGDRVKDGLKRLLGR